MRQKNVAKGLKEKSTKPGYHMYIDLTSPKYISTRGSKYWFLAVDEATHMKFSMFLKHKSEMKESFVPFLKELRHTYGIKIEHTLDVTMQEKIMHLRIYVDSGIIFKYTAPGTPQQNGVVERAFATMLGQTRAIMNGAGFDENKRHLFWTEADNTITHLENMMIRKGMTCAPHYLFYGSDSPYAQHLQVFGKLAIVKVLNATNKLSDRGMKAIFVGYTDKHAGNVYRFINPNKHKIYYLVT